MFRFTTSFAFISLITFFNSAIAGQSLVKFNNNDRHNQNIQILNQLNLKIEEFIPQLNIFVLHENINSAKINKLQATGEVNYVQPNHTIYLAETTPNDKKYNQQWHHRKINSALAWDVTKGSEQVVVAVIDTGISLNHEDLKNQIWQNINEIAGNNIDDDQNGFIDDVKGWNFAKKNNNPDDDQSHGSHCAGIIGAEGNNTLGIAGINWNVKLMALKFITAAGTGSELDAMKSIIYASDNGAHIINASWGSADHSQALSDAIEYANKKNVLFVAAAGNYKTNNDRKPFYPSGYTHSNVISVAASTTSHNKADFSNYGKNTVHVAAPGENIYSTSKGKSYETKSGTSMAAPMVSGIAALVLARNQNLHATDLKNIIMNSVLVTKSWKSRVISGGVVQADKALALANSN